MVRDETELEFKRRTFVRGALVQAQEAVGRAQAALDGTITSCEHCKRNSDVNRTEALLKRRLKSTKEKLNAMILRLERPTREGLCPEDEHEEG